MISQPSDPASAERAVATVLKHELRTDKEPAPIGAYSQGILSGDLVFTAGCGPIDVLTGQMPDGVGPQTEQTLRNVEAILAEAGCTLDDALKVTVHLADLADFDAFDAAYRTFFTAPYPVRTTVGSALLGGILVEIDVIARAPRTR